MTEERYTHGHHESVLRAHSWRTIENSAAYLEPFLRPGLDLLDVGSGPGTITLEFAERLAPGEVTGIDASAEVVAKAEALAGAESLDNLGFAVGDAYETGFADGAFDIAHAHQVLQHVSDPVAVLKEMARVVKTGGVVAARDADYSAASFWPELPGLSLWSEVYHRVARSNGGEPDAGRRLVAWAHEAGFAEVRTSATIWVFSSASEREWWGGLWAERTLEPNYARQAVDGGFATTDELQQVADAWLEWARHPDGWFGMPHGEIVATVAD